MLCISDADTNDIIGTAIVWDFTAAEVLILTNYHTWEDGDYTYCFPPMKKKKRSTLCGMTNRPQTYLPCYHDSTIIN